jgi:hypothetical protein
MKGAIAFTDYIRIVDEDIAGTVFFLNETIAFLAIEPLYFTVYHISPFEHYYPYSRNKGEPLRLRLALVYIF